MFSANVLINNPAQLVAIMRHYTGLPEEEKFWTQVDEKEVKKKKKKSEAGR